MEMIATIVMHIAGILWLAFGAFVFFGHGVRPGPIQGEVLVAGCLFLSFGMLFVGIGGLIGALRKRAA
jgi:hypothetical protein